MHHIPSPNAFAVAGLIWLALNVAIAVIMTVRSKPRAAPLLARAVGEFAIEKELRPELGEQI